MGLPMPWGRSLEHRVLALQLLDLPLAFTQNALLSPDDVVKQARERGVHIEPEHLLELHRRRALVPMLRIVQRPPSAPATVPVAASAIGAYTEYRTPLDLVITAAQAGHLVDPDDHAYSIAVSPDGSAVYVTGASGSAAATVAYNAATGARLWVKRYSVPGGYSSQASSVTVSPNGNTVFITGSSTVTFGNYTTVAYDAATGAQLWAEHYNGPGNADDEAASVRVSPTGNAVYVTGESWGTAQVYDYATIAYDPATGAPLWVKRYNGPANIGGQATAVVISPSGGTVFVTGQTAAGSGDYATVAYNAATGAQLWAKPKLRRARGLIW
jgi:WD40 repeat protein